MWPNTWSAARAEKFFSSSGFIERADSEIGVPSRRVPDFDAADLSFAGEFNFQKGLAGQRIAAILDRLPVTVIARAVKIIFAVHAHRMIRLAVGGNGKLEV